ncbi:hypothetical protein DH2020_016020 [Rehmannia glutinosa]|uniref:Uncharacterized protein n=1 Tax=Rehmannia glutinosa TaxID=99300 RepID=A0ABR0WUA8_REHGL
MSTFPRCPIRGDSSFITEILTHLSFQSTRGPNINISVDLDHEQILHVHFSSPPIPHTIHAGFVYAKCTRRDRRPLIGSNTNRGLDMEVFSEVIADCGFTDPGCTGHFLHTWVRNDLFERLDRFLFSPHWQGTFSKTSVTHLPRVRSDHAPLLLQTDTSASKPPGIFRYMKMWSHHHTFLDVIKEVWAYPTGVAGMLNLQYKLIYVKQKLKWWNKKVFGNSFENLTKTEHAVQNAEYLYDSQPSVTHLISLKKAIPKLTLASKIEEYWYQKSTYKWILEAERNTQYFHTLVNLRRSKSKIFSIQMVLTLSSLMLNCKNLQLIFSLNIFPTTFSAAPLMWF